MAIVRATESPRFDLPGVHFFGLLAPGRGSTELCTWRLEVDPGAGANDEPHQLDHEEVFVILEGSLTITIDGQPFDLGLVTRWQFLHDLCSRWQIERVRKLQRWSVSKPDFEQPWLVGKRSVRLRGPYKIAHFIRSPDF